MASTVKEEADLVVGPKGTAQRAENVQEIDSFSFQQFRARLPNHSHIDTHAAHMLSRQVFVKCQNLGTSR